MSEKNIVNIVDFSIDKVIKIASYLYEYNLSYKGVVIEYIEKENCLCIKEDGCLDEYINIENNLGETLILVIEKIDAKYTFEIENHAFSLTEEVKEVEEVKETKKEKYKGRYVIFPTIRTVLKFTFTIEFFLMIFEIILNVIVMYTESASILLTIISVISVISQYAFIMGIIWILYIIIDSLCGMDIDLENVKKKIGEKDE